jgi:hypothetical protein
MRRNYGDVSYIQDVIDTAYVSRVRPSAKAATAVGLLSFRPFPVTATKLERAGRVKGGAAAERSEDTLDAPEHSNRLTKGNGVPVVHSSH